MTEHSKDQLQNDDAKAKRARGRPVGSSRFTDGDKKILRAAAKAMAHDRSKTITSTLRDDQNIVDPSTQARLRKKWRVEGPDYLQRAQDELLAQSGSGNVFDMLRVFNDLNEYVEKMFESPSIHQFVRSIIDAHNSSEARQRLGMTLKVPFYPSDETVVFQLIKAFETRDKSDDVVIFERTNKREALSDAERHYGYALIYFAMAMDAKARKGDQSGDIDEGGTLDE